jgi:outer membrane receptor protein involved in Fe transport
VLIKRGVSDASDLMKVVPGFTYTKTHDSIPVFSIRGVGYYDNNLGATPAVSAYVDEVPLPYPVLTMGATLDLERVEALKGPQGTLFGQNATGGALNFIAGKPRDDTEGRLSVGYGKFNTLETSGYLTGALSESLNARIGFSYEDSDDWQKSYTHNGETGATRRGAVRLSLEWAPTDDVNVLYAVESWFDQSKSQAAQLLGLAINVPGAQNEGLATGDGSDENPLTRVYPNATQEADKADWTPDEDKRADNQYLRNSMRVSYDINENLSLTSITAYQTLDYHTRTDPDGTALKIAALSIDADIEAFYQELRLSGDSGDLNWMLGVNYANGTVVSEGNPNFRDWSIAHLFDFLPPELGVFGLTDFHFVTRNKATTTAGFFNLEYAISDALTWQGGARYTKQELNMRGCPEDSGNGHAASFFNFTRGSNNIAPGGCYSLNDLDGSFAPEEADMDLNENNVSWRTGLNYRVNSSTLLYGNVSKGYKSGAFTIAVFDLFSQAIPATQESILAYEAGFKLSSSNMQLNAATFYYDYKDKQQLAPFDTHGPFGVLDKLLNIPESRVVGAEFDFLWAPVDGLRLSLNGTFIDSEVSSSFITSDPTGQSVDLEGESFIYTPRWEPKGDIEYSFYLGDNMYASIGTSMSYRSSTNARFSVGSDYAIDS